MFDVFLAEILILFLLLAVEARVALLFTKIMRTDSLVIFAPIALVISLMSIFVCGLHLFLIFAVILSLAVFATNIRQLSRLSFGLSSRLFFEQCSIFFLVATFLEFVATLILIFVVFFFRPVKYNEFNLGVSRTRQYFSGSTATGIIESEDFAQSGKKSGILYTYTPNAAKIANSEQSGDFGDVIIVFSGCATGEIAQYEPYLLLLAQKGFTILAADFFTNFFWLTSDFREHRLCRRFFSISRRLKSKIVGLTQDEIEKQKNAYAALGKFALEKYGRTKKVFFVNDGLDPRTSTEIAADFGRSALGFFSIAALNEYKTSLYGFVEQTDIVLARMNGQKRDSSLFIPRYAALKTTQSVENALVKSAAQLEQPAPVPAASDPRLLFIQDYAQSDP